MSVVLTAPLTHRSLRRIMSGVAPAGLLVQVCSFGSSVTLAHVLGATASTDAYYLGLSIPVLAFGLFLGSLRQAAIPALTEVSHRNEGALAAAGSELLTSVTAAATVITVIVVAVAELLLPLFAQADLLHETRIIMLELAPYGILGAITGALGALLAVRGTFVLPVAVVAFESILKIVLMVAFGRSLGVQSLVIGCLLGSSLGVVVLFDALRRQGIRLAFRPRFYSPFVRSTIALSLPLIASMSVLQVNPVIDRSMATELGAGKITALELGLRLFLVPAGLVSSLMIAPVTATWSTRFASGGWEELRSSAERAIRTIAVVVPPVVAIGVALRRQIVDVLFAGGAYPSAALHDTASVLGLILLALPAQALMVVLATLFVVQKDTVFPMKVAFVNVVLNVALNFAFRPVLGVAGIALSTSLTYCLLAFVYVWAIRNRWGPVVRGASGVAIRTVASGAVTVGGALAVLAALPAAHTRLSAVVAIAAVGAAATVAQGAFVAIGGHR